MGRHQFLEPLESRLCLSGNFTIDDVTRSEGNFGGRTFLFTVRWNDPGFLESATVQYRTVDNTATAADDDYIPDSGTLLFNFFETEQTIGIEVRGDTKFEPDEVFAVELFNPDNADLGDGHGFGTILNDDAQPAVSMSIANVDLPEGNAGVKQFPFQVSLSQPSAQTITVDYTTQDSEASVLDDDYAPTSGRLTFDPGVTSRTINVQVTGDNFFEDDEEFYVALTNPLNVFLQNSFAAGTIRNDDPPPTLSINDVNAAEGTGGTKDYVFQVTLSKPSKVLVRVEYHVADDTAIAGEGDYTPHSGDFFFDPGMTTRTITVSVFGDHLLEPDERFLVILSGATGADIADSQGIGTIRNDDEPPRRVQSVSFQNATSPHQLRYVFSEPWAVGPGFRDLTLQNFTTGQVLDSSYVTVSYDPPSRTATFSIIGLPRPGPLSGVLADGDWQATFNNPAVDGDRDSNPGGPHVSTFFHLTADANHNRSVGFADLVVLAQNYNTTNKTFSTGDFDYDTDVDFTDLVLLAQRYNTSLPASPVPAAATPQSTPPVLPAAPPNQPRRPPFAARRRII